MEDHDDLYVIREGFIYDAHTGERLGAHDQNRKPFDAPGHMRKIRTRQGMQDYLDVKWRVAWIRADYPGAQLATEQIEADAEHARFKATIRLPDGALATGHGSETLNDFPDFYEKAETKAIGRACAALGYGTDAAGDDFDEGAPEASKEAPVRTNTHTYQSVDGTYKERAPNPVPPQDAAPVPQAPQAPTRAPSKAMEDLRANAGAHTVPVRSGGRSERANNARRAREQEMMAVAVPGFKPDGGPVRTAEAEAAAHLEELRPAMPPVAPKMPVNDQASNIHQHAQLRAMADAGIPVLERIKEQYGKESVEALTRDEAKDVIIASRADVRKLAQS